jgi:hypothetical protein
MMDARQSLDGYSFAKVPFGVRRSVLLDFVRSLGIDPNEVTTDGLRLDRSTVYLTLKAHDVENNRDRLPLPSSAILTHTFEIDILDDVAEQPITEDATLDELGERMEQATRESVRRAMGKD